MHSIQCKQLTKHYQNKIAVSQLSLSLRPGSITGLLGANGAGKSTLIRSILGLIQVDSGTVEKTEGSRIGYLPELAQLPPSLSAWALIRLALQLSSLKSKCNIEPILQTVRLAETHWHKPLGNLSKGMRQRAALAYAIAGNPQWLILDEPMSGLDAMGRKQFLDILLELNRQGTGILVCSHIVPDLVRLCDRVLLIHQGRIIDEVDIVQHNMDEAEVLESRLMQMVKLEP